MRIGIGIDTGGTYTDAAAYDFEAKKVLASAKALTTKTDLTIGILEALDGLPASVLKQAELVSLSTTLATNACVEDKGGKAKLVFFGGNRDIIDELGGKYGLPPVQDIHIQEAFTTFSGEILHDPDWNTFRAALAEGYDDCAGVGIVESNAIKNGGTVEKAAKAIFRETHSIPVVCGYELFNALNSLQRAAGTLLNARLFPVIQEFLDAIKAALSQRGVEASLVIVRSNGGLMSEAFAADRPVETLLCGPAASVMGASGLADEANSIIVDMGGTTTDIALVRDGAPVSVENGVRIGKWRTFVDGLYVKTLGLGGDSAVHYTDDAVRLEAYRVVPLCVAAAAHPRVLDNLRALDAADARHTMPLHEHYLLVRDISNNPHYTERERAFCAALQNGPLPLRDAPSYIGMDMYNVNVSRLLTEGVVQMCGLTPTDIMHIQGDFDAYNKEAAVLAARFVARCLDCTVDALCGMVYDEVKRKLYHSVVTAMLENKNPRYMKEGIHRDIEDWIDECYKAAKSGKADPLAAVRFQTTFPLVGIGAPIKVFLNDVAALLGTKAVIAEHYEVANALGAIMGSISATYTVAVRPARDENDVECFAVFADGGKQLFAEREEAEAFAAEEAEAGAKREAKQRGAKGGLTVACHLAVDEAPARDCRVYIGTDVVCTAAGQA